MKKLIALCLVLFLFVPILFADVTATIIGKSVDERGNIVVKTQYKIDGVEVVSNYPKENGKYYWVTRYNVINFFGMDAERILRRIEKDIKEFSESLILKSFQEEEVSNLRNANSQLFNSSDFDIVGFNSTTSTAKMLIDRNFDGKPDTQITAKTDGTKTETPYTLIP